jgi:hypothetical protein
MEGPRATQLDLCPCFGLALSAPIALNHWNHIIPLFLSLSLLAFTKVLFFDKKIVFLFCSRRLSTEIPVTHFEFGPTQI